MQNNRLCQNVFAEVSPVTTSEAGNVLHISAKETEEDTDADSGNDSATASHLDEKSGRINKYLEDKKRQKNKDSEVKVESILTCIGCEKTFQVRSKLKEHCKTCDIYLIIKKQQRSKTEKKSIKTYNTKCILCDIVFPSRYRLKQHEILSLIHI